MWFITDLSCIICRSDLRELDAHYQCINCGRQYVIDSETGIADFISAPSQKIAPKDFSELYKTAEDLETRVKFFNSRFSHDLDREPFFSWLNDNKAKVLEAGCGTMKPLLPAGAHYQEGQSIAGVDNSWALLMKAAQNSPRTALFHADASVMPFRNGSFDLVWARHMLYHTDDPAAVVAECLRCLSPTGVFGTSTNSETNKVEMHRFHAQLLQQLGLLQHKPERASLRFSAENGDALLKQYFKHVIVFPYSGFFTFKSNAEFLEYYFSTAYFKWLTQLSDIPVAELKEIAYANAEQHGVIELSNNGAVMLASNDPAMVKAAEISMHAAI